MGKLIAITGGIEAERVSLISKIQKLYQKDKVEVFSVEDAIKKAQSNFNNLIKASEIFYPDGCTVYCHNSKDDYVLFESEVLKYILESKENYKKWQAFWCNIIKPEILSLKEKNNYIIVDFLNLFESDLEYIFDKIIFIDTPWRERLEEELKSGKSIKEFWNKEYITFCAAWKKDHSDVIIKNSDLYQTTNLLL